MPHLYSAGSHGGEHVQVEGSFDNWSTRQQLQRSGREFTVVKLLPPGVYQVRNRRGKQQQGQLLLQHGNSSAVAGGLGTRRSCWHQARCMMCFMPPQHCAVREPAMLLIWLAVLDLPLLCVCVCAAPSCLQYKFIVDGDWKHDPNQRAMHDENGNVNNVIEVQEYVPENLENISGFDPPPSPSARCAGVQRARCCSIECVVCSTQRAQVRAAQRLFACLAGAQARPCLVSSLKVLC